MADKGNSIPSIKYHQAQLGGDFPEAPLGGPFRRACVAQAELQRASAAQRCQQAELEKTKLQELQLAAQQKAKWLRGTPRVWPIWSMFPPGQPSFGAGFLSHRQMAVGVKNRVTPNWFALVNGNMDSNLRFC